MTAPDNLISSNLIYIIYIYISFFLGVNVIDSAPWYGQGKSETLLGVALKDVPRSAYYLNTKVKKNKKRREMKKKGKSKTLHVVALKDVPRSAYCHLNRARRRV
jgi:aryl-alcohol dehydrogenase-like predicted oxidoreductase